MQHKRFLVNYKVNDFKGNLACSLACWLVGCLDGQWMDKLHKFIAIPNNATKKKNRKTNKKKKQIDNSKQF